MQVGRLVNNLTASGDVLAADLARAQAAVESFRGEPYLLVVRTGCHLTREAKEALRDGVRHAFAEAGKPCPPVLVVGPGFEVEAVRPDAPGAGPLRPTAEGRVDREMRKVYGPGWADDPDRRQLGTFLAAGFRALARDAAEASFADAYRFGMLRRLLAEAGCPWPDGCHIPSAVGGWVDGLKREAERLRGVARHLMHLIEPDTVVGTEADELEQLKAEVEQCGDVSPNRRP
jgi:hypothetical protein